MARSGRALGALVVLTTALWATAAAGVSLPKPGSPPVVRELVSTSHEINKLPGGLVPPLQRVQFDNTAAFFPTTRGGCAGTTACVFGSTKASRTVVLFGDSHAAMWLPPLVWVAAQLDLKVVLMWMPGCPDADVSVWNPSSHSINVQCNRFRSSSLSSIARLGSSLVLLSDRTNNIYGAGDRRITSAQWQVGFESTLATLRTDHLASAVIGDITALTNEIPECLAAFPKHIQRCSSPNPNPAMHQHVDAEMAAARADGVDYINPQPWLCTATCSPVVGDLAVYTDSEHVSAVYASFLGEEFEGALRPLLSA